MSRTTANTRREIRARAGAGTTHVMTLGKESYDAIVVGSGFGGAVATCRLAQAGVDVGLLERGRRFTPGSFPRHRTRPDLQHWRRGGLYDVRHLQDVLVVQGVGYGGGSLLYANVQVRPPADVFEEGWPAPYSRALLDPYYDLVGYMLDITPIEENPATGELPPKTPPDGGRCRSARPRGTDLPAQHRGAVRGRG